MFRSSPDSGFVTYGPVKLAHLRAWPVVSLSWRAGWLWVSVDGTTELIGPGGRLPGFHPGRLPWLLRDIYTFAGGQHPGLDAYDRVMAEQRRVAVLVAPTRAYTNTR